MDSIVIAILVFVSIYFVWYLFRLFADFFLVGIALGSAALAYHIPDWYPIFLMVLEESNILNLFGLTLPPNQPDVGATIVIASFIIIGAVVISIPFLPFSATYRIMFGVEGPVFRRKEAKIRAWIVEEIQRYHQPQPQEPDRSNIQITKNPSNSHFKKGGIFGWYENFRFPALGSAITDFWNTLKSKKRSFQMKRG